MRKWIVRTVLVLMFLSLQGPATSAATPGGGSSVGQGADHPCGYDFGGGLAAAIRNAAIR